MPPRLILRLSIPFIILAAMSWAWYADKSGSVHATQVALDDCGKGVDQAKSSLIAAQKDTWQTQSDHTASIKAAEDRLDEAKAKATECERTTRSFLEDRTLAMNTAMVLGIVFSLAAVGGIAFGIARRRR